MKKKRLQEIIDKQRALQDKAEAEKRNFTLAEQKEWDSLESEWNELRSQSKYQVNRPFTGGENELREMGLNNNEGHMNMHRKLDNKRSIIYDKRTLRKEVEGDDYQFDPKGSELRDAFNRYLIHGASGISNSEFRALQSDIDDAGGYLKMPVQMANHIIIELDNILHIRQKATSFQLTQSDTFKVPELANDISDPDWTGEITQVN